MIEPRRQALACAALAVAAVLLWEWATVTANYGGNWTGLLWTGGNWTALFCTGAARGVPPKLAGEHIYVFPNSSGYDGQLYHYIAHEPFMLDPELKAFTDEPRLRYRRILLPALAWTAALGQPGAIDTSYIVICLLFIGVGVFWGCEACRQRGLQPAWGLAFLAVPGVLISIDRLVPDVLLAALAVGFAVHWKRPSWRLFAILAAAALTRETGLLFIAGYCLYLLAERHWAQALKYAMSALPAAAWCLYVYARSAPYDYNASFVPFSAIVQGFLNPAAYPASVPLVELVRAADFAALAGVLVAFTLALAALRTDRQPETFVMVCFALTGIVLQRRDHWLNVYDYGRVYTPVLIFLALQAATRKSAVWLSPALAMLPRIGLQLAPQAIGIARAIL